MDAIYLRHIDTTMDRRTYQIRTIAAAYVLGTWMAISFAHGGLREPAGRPPLAELVLLPVSAPAFSTGSSTVSSTESTEPTDQASTADEPSTVVTPILSEGPSSDAANHSSEAKSLAFSSEERTPVLIPAAPAASTAGITMLLFAALFSFRKVRYRLFCR